MSDKAATHPTNMVKEGVERLRQLKGRMIHVVAGNNLLRFRLDKDGKLLKETPRRMIEAGKEAPRIARREWRKVVTGDPDKRIRDHMKEVPQVKMIDKLSFTLGVLCICGTEWLALRHPEMFPVYYYSLMTLLMVIRYITYSQDKYELFMLDFCYFLNLSVICQTWLFPNNLPWFKANYVLTMGPLIFAIVVWHNSLVFHSLDKLTSFFLHVFPPLTMHLYRWRLIPSEIMEEEDRLSVYEWLVLPLGLYLVWQLGYLLVTGVILDSRLRSDPELITSVRYLTRDKKNPLKLMITKLLVRWKVLEPGEDLNPDDFSAKLIFAVTQLVYTAIAILPAPLLYGNYILSCCFLVILYGWGTWNGASYYIEIFSERYKLKFVKLEEGEKLKKEEIDSEDEYENASDTLDVNDELYKTIMEALQVENGEETDNVESKGSDGNVEESGCRKSSSESNGDH